ncbi:hypothetical protein ASH01_14370 [Terrabacter sp. Soil811]|uniref:hypothetical protein n=1 Tax=Terrabacter sp. Soil811 TaxID=1736419 RepID=UPI0006FBA4BE|nr:hypothetical protein [Terrabacter sp. Soil811]KRF45104.1 hypothetical protein ASH01_14370 [Terrabacter sp. Soil811]
MDIEGTAHRLEDMTPGYRVNVLAWLDANAAYFHAMTIRKHLIEVYAELLDGRVDPLALRRLHHILASGPEQWLAATAIVQALKDAVGERGTSANQPRTVHPRRPPLGGPVPGVERLIITTENSRYDLDLRGGRVRRVPSTGARMRADSQWVPVRDVRPVEVGAPMAMRLDVRGDGVPTVRLTSPVIGVTTA